MNDHTSRLRLLLPLICCAAILALPGGCSDTPSRGGPDLGGGSSTGTTGGPGTPTIGPGGSSETPTTGDPTDTNTTNSTSHSTSDSTSTSTGEPIPSCGDGAVDPGEACDNGAANSDNAFCTSKCKLNYCGDGLLLIGWEICDDGPANSDTYGSTCSAQCTPAPRCGDHILQTDAGEECDLGPENGGPEIDEQGITCGESCRSNSLRAFVTSEAFTGDLGGLDGADHKCRDAAIAAGLVEPHRFHAYLSTPDFSANDRFPGLGAEPLPYVLVTGKKLADSHANLLLEGPQAQGLSVTEIGTDLYNGYVATNTGPSGNSYSPDQHCLAWTNADPQLKVRVGFTFPKDPNDLPAWLTEDQWVNKKTVDCMKPILHLYCLEI